MDAPSITVSAKSSTCSITHNQRRRLKRGIHDIEKEIEFEGNSKIIAHDSEGFEAGRRAEVDVVRKFIDSRSQVQDINQKLHLVWFVLLLFSCCGEAQSNCRRYCMPMNSRPIQQAEINFFSMPLTGKAHR